MSFDTPIPLLAATIGVLYLIYQFLLWPVFLSPVAKIPPAHPIARFTSAWIFWIRYKRREVQTIHQAHQKLGPIIRLGPEEISVNCVKGGIQTVYSGGFEKGTPDGNWYAFFANYDG
jgi:hypothetical protein